MTTSSDSLISAAATVGIAGAAFSMFPKSKKGRGSKKMSKLGLVLTPKGIKRKNSLIDRSYKSKLTDSENFDVNNLEIVYGSRNLTRTELVNSISSFKDGRDKARKSLEKLIRSGHIRES